MTERVVGVVGAGLMGAGIAQVAAASGSSVIVQDVGEEQLARGLASITSSLNKFVDKQRMTREQADDTLSQIVLTTDLADLAEATFVVEAVFERLEVKTTLFRVLDEIVGPDAVLATNTSALPITQVAAVTTHPQRVVGAHFFSPVPLMALCEVVRGYRTSDETMARASAFAEQVGKTVVVVNRDVAGFVTTRLISALALEAARLVESGVATAHDVDTACRLGFGHAMGPLETMDLTGVDIMVNAADNVAAETPGDTFAVPGLLRRMVAAGDLGRKTGQGFYPHP
ncbi:MAG: 3-hydroxyacyl-CoA dehydrogenase family protein [Actinomycetes bacterium]